MHTKSSEDESRNSSFLNLIMLYKSLWHTFGSVWSGKYGELNYYFMSRTLLIYESIRLMKHASSWHHNMVPMRGLPLIHLLHA